MGWARSVVFTAPAGGSTIVAGDAETGDEIARWNAAGPIASLAYDVDAPRLLVGRADTGTVDAYELAGLLASPDGRAPPAGPPIVTGLAAVSQIDVPREGGVLLFRGPDGVAVADRATDEVRGTADGSYGGMAYVQATGEEQRLRRGHRPRHATRSSSSTPRRSRSTSTTTARSWAS